MSESQSDIAAEVERILADKDLKEANSLMTIAAVTAASVGVYLVTKRLINKAVKRQIRKIEK